MVTYNNFSIIRNLSNTVNIIKVLCIFDANGHISYVFQKIVLHSGVVRVITVEQVTSGVLGGRFDKEAIFCHCVSSINSLLCALCLHAVLIKWRLFLNVKVLRKHWTCGVRTARLVFLK